MDKDSNRFVAVNLTDAEWRALRAVTPDPCAWMKTQIRRLLDDPRFERRKALVTQKEQLRARVRCVARVARILVAPKPQRFHARQVALLVRNVRHAAGFQRSIRGRERQ